MGDAKRILYSGRYLDLAARNGWEYAARRHRVVVIIAWTPADELLLVEQFRIPVNNRTIELPAGLVGDEDGQENESLITAACRELEEETGWRPAKCTPLMTCPTSAGLTDEVVTFMRAEGLQPAGDGGGDATEDIVVHRIRSDQVGAWLERQYRDGLSIDPKIYTALYYSGHENMQPMANGNPGTE